MYMDKNNFFYYMGYTHAHNTIHTHSISSLTLKRTEINEIFIASLNSCRNSTHY